MVQIAGLRGVLPEPSKLNEVITGAARAGLDVAKGLAAGSMLRDPGRCLYRYHLAFGDAETGRTLVRKMIVCAVRLEPWADGLVRPHEAVAPAAKAAMVAALKATAVQAAPLLAGYRDAAAEVDRLFRRVDAERPTLEVTTSDRAVHRLWRVKDAELLGSLRHLFAPKKLHVLDGHDRYEALLDHRDGLATARPLAMYSAANYALASLVKLDDPTLVVAARHRVIRGGAASQAALAAAKPFFLVEKLAGAAKDLARQRAALADNVAHQPAFVVVWPAEPDAWKLTLALDVSAVNEGIQVHRALQKYDPVIVDQLFLARAMPGAKVETVTTAEEALAAKADALVIMRALTIEQIAHVTELGQVLPPGSTAFAPPLAPGLVSAVIDPDEDLV
jgi:uncharacterized protein (DUF1015 family)